MKPCPPLRLLMAEAGASSAFLFLDYDGTLAGFAPNPDEVLPDPQVLDLLSCIVAREELRLAVVSGRRLAHVCRLVPLTGLWLAGAYGLEMQTPQGEEIHRLNLAQLRPRLAAFKPIWQALLVEKNGFYLEDKGWSLAIHASRAEEDVAAAVMAQARAERIPQGFRLLGGERFLEVCPPQADKGAAVEAILDHEGVTNDLLVFVGDDDKDELAFRAVQARNGAGIVVAAQERPSAARYRLQSPQAVRDWLTAYLD